MEPPERLKELTQPTKLLFRAARASVKDPNPTLGDPESEKDKI